MSPAATWARGGASGRIHEEAATASDRANGDPRDSGDGGDPGKPGERGGPRDSPTAVGQLRRRYGLLLALLITSYLLSAFSNGRWINDLQIALFTVAGLLAIRNSSLRRRTARGVTAAGFVTSLLVIAVADHQGGATGQGAAAIWSGVLLLLMVVEILRQILVASQVTLQSIYGAISAYLVIGLMFSAFYTAIYYLNSRMFFVQGAPGNVKSDFQYFSFTTLTTLGYGDFTAAGSGGRAVAMLEAMTGQIFLATLVAKLVASFRPITASGNSADGDSGGDN